MAQAVHGHPMLFAIGYALSRVVRTVEWLVCIRTTRGTLPPSPTYALAFLSAALWGISAGFHAPSCYLLWAAGLGAELSMLVVA